MFPVAFFDRVDRHHGWITARIDELEAPLLVCDPVLTEAAYLLSRFPAAQDALFELIENGALSLAFRIEKHVEAVRKLLRRYRDRPMSLADACVVRMAEIHEGHAVLTLDSDFAIYRKHRRVPLTLIHPTVGG